MRGMDKAIVKQKLEQAGIVPVIRSQNPDQAVMAAQALAKGGIFVSEITMTVPDAMGAAKRLMDTDDDLIIGAGTVTDTAMCKKAIVTGCAFVVTPMVNPDIIALCRDAGVFVAGGALTPTEIFNTHAAGADAVKVFPAAAVGGPAYIRMIRGPFPHIPLVPTGGVNLSTVLEFLEAGALFTGAGGDMVPAAALEKGDAASITDRAKQYVEKIRRFRRQTAKA